MSEMGGTPTSVSCFSLMHGSRWPHSHRGEGCEDEADGDGHAGIWGPDQQRELVGNSHCGGIWERLNPNGAALIHPLSPAGTPSSSTSTSSTSGTCVRRSSSPARGKSQTAGCTAACTSSPPQATGECHGGDLAPMGAAKGWQGDSCPPLNQAASPRPGVHAEAEQDRQRGASDCQGRHAHSGGAGGVQTAGEGRHRGFLALLPPCCGLAASHTLCPADPAGPEGPRHQRVPAGGFR